MMARRLMTAGALLALATGATAQPTPVSPPPVQPAVEGPATIAPTVTVTAPRLEQVPDLVQNFGVPDNKGRLARWENPVCPVVRGLPRDMDLTIEQRIRETAKAASILVAGPRCAANVAVLITRTPRAAAESMVERHRSILSGQDRWPFDRVHAAAFVEDERPVRWWYISDSVPTEGGKAFAEAAVPQQSAAFATNNLFGPPTYGEVVSSRLKPATEEAFSRVVIIVDANRIVGFDLAQISAYLSMVSLAQVKPDADLDHVKTIMNMFDDRSSGREPSGDLTFWDRAYLGALYDTDAEINFSMQRSSMVAHIRHDVAAHDVIPLSATRPAAPAS